MRAPTPASSSRSTRDLLEHAGADAAEHVVAGLALEDDGVDAGLVQQLAEQQARRAGADDRDLGSRGGHEETFIHSFRRTDEKADLADAVDAAVDAVAGHARGPTPSGVPVKIRSPGCRW